MSDDLATFLLARYDEESEAAQAATQGPWFWADEDTSSFPQYDHSLMADQGTWKVCEYFCQWSGEANLHRGEPGKPGHEHRVTETVVSGWGYDASGLHVEDADAEHIARHDPARVLAELAAKRAILDQYEHKQESMALYPNQGNAGGLMALDAVLRLLALPVCRARGIQPGMASVSDRIEFGVFPPDWVRLPVCSWLQRHGVNPNMVAVPGWIERQPETYRLAWESYVPDEDNVIRLNEAGDDALREARHVQLEGPPLPWPDELTLWVNYEVLRPYAGTDG